MFFISSLLVVFEKFVHMVQSIVVKMLYPGTSVYNVIILSSEIKITTLYGKLFNWQQTNIWNMTGYIFKTKNRIEII